MNGSFNGIGNVNVMCFGRFNHFKQKILLLQNITILKLRTPKKCFIFDQFISTICEKWV